LNQKICNKLKTLDVLTVIEVRRLEWLGHIVRMEVEKTIKQLLEEKPGEGKKKVDLN
jgi:hypothetical protein